MFRITPIAETYPGKEIRNTRNGEEQAVSGIR
jgi:hypothetical protein